jgi:hypothetical protein
VTCTGLKAEWKSTIETTTQFPVVEGTEVKVTCSISGAFNKGSSAVTCVIGTEFSYTNEPSCSKPGNSKERYNVKTKCIKQDKIKCF